MAQCLQSFGLVSLLIILPACQSQTSTPDSVTQTKVEGGATLKQVTLKQANNQGQLLWELQAKTVTYAEDSNVAQVQGLQGKLYAQGQPIYKIRAEQGTVEQTGQVVILKGKTITTDLRNQLILKAPLLQWAGETGQLEARTGFALTHPQVKIQGRWLQASTQAKQVRARGKVIAETQPKQFRLKTDQLLWQIDKHFMNAGSSKATATTAQVTIEQLRSPKHKQVTNRAYAGSVRFNLKGQVITLQNPAQVKLVQPLLDITSRRIVWDLKRQILSSNQLIEANHRQEKVAVLANQGIYNQRKKVVQFKGQVEVEGTRNQSKLTANTLIWQLDKRRVDARGNVQYQQGKPPLRVKGPKAVGKIQNQLIQISGGNVVTEIIP